MARRVYTESDVRALLVKGGSAADVPADAILTPSARDRLREAAGAVASVRSVPVPAPAEPILPDYVYEWTPGADPKTPAEIQAFFTSPPIEELKRRMCDIGRRMWEREYTDGNGGNLVVRVGDNLFLTTQTLISKGFMTPETISLVDFDGKQLAGKYKRTSECMTHLAIFRNQPKARATCHAHPVHATAYAVAGVRPPTCMIPEAEVFLGQIGIAEYQTPGTPANAKVVGEVAKEHHSILMLNHGVITWGDHIEDAYWKMENTDSYCKTIWIASQLGTDLKTITGGQARELIELRKSLGMSDKREGWKECELCDNAEFRPGVICRNPSVSPERSEVPPRRDPSSSSSPSPSSSSPSPSPRPDETEVLVQRITDLIMEKLQA